MHAACYFTFLVIIFYKFYWMNFRRNLTKSSIKSTASLGKLILTYAELSKLRYEVEFLRQTVESLKISIERRDTSIGTLAREKENLYVELKTAQRANRNLHQQLLYEREIHSKENEYLIEEIKEISKNNCESGIYCEANGVQEALKLKELLKYKDEVICNVCAKYLKMKTKKKRLQRKNEILQLRCQKIYENVTKLLHDNRYSLDTLLNLLLHYCKVSLDGSKSLNPCEIYEVIRLRAHFSSENGWKNFRTKKIENIVSQKRSKKVTECEGNLKVSYSNNETSDLQTSTKIPKDMRICLASTNNLHKSKSEPCLHVLLR